MPAAASLRNVGIAQPQVEVDDHYLVALAKSGKDDAYDRIVRRYYGFVRLKASSYFLIGGDSDDLIQEGLVGLYKAVRDYRSDRESSFRNFAELCITRQIITAVKTSTRNKHTPLNQYVSFSATPAAAGDSEPTLDEVLPGPTAHDPVNQVISSEELHSLVACLSSVLSELESSVLSLYLDGHSYEAIAERLALRHEDRRQRAPARQAQGRRPPAVAQRAALDRGARPARRPRTFVAVLAQAWLRRARCRRPGSCPPAVHSCTIAVRARSSPCSASMAIGLSQRREAARPRGARRPPPRPPRRPPTAVPEGRRAPPQLARSSASTVPATLTPRRSRQAEPKPEPTFAVAQVKPGQHRRAPLEAGRPGARERRRHDRVRLAHHPCRRQAPRHAGSA